MRVGRRTDHHDINIRITQDRLIVGCRFRNAILGCRVARCRFHHIRNRQHTHTGNAPGQRFSMNLTNTSCTNNTHVKRHDCLQKVRNRRIITLIQVVAF
jgi:hypothetical protein